MRNERLIEARVNAGLEIAEVADKAGIGEHVVRGAENGRRPRAGSARAIADVFDMQVTDLWPIAPLVAMPPQPSPDLPEAA